MAAWRSGNGVTVEAPDNIIPRERATTKRGRNARSRAEPEDVLSSVFADAGMLASIVEMEQLRRDGLRLRAGRHREIVVSVEVGPDEDAVLLVEGQGGVYTWVTPERSGARPARPRRGPATRVFRFSGRAALDSSTRLRGPVTDWFIEKLIDPVRVYALRFVVGRTLDAALNMLEGDFQEGLLSLCGKNPRTWTPGTPVPPPAGDGARILLFVHGAFSTTAGSFGQLTAHNEGRAFLEKARKQYDAILGFDHKSLGKSPAENSKEMLVALEKWGLPKNAHIDAVAFSRGGLVYRLFAEKLLAKKRRDVTLGKAVFVGCTNGGTHLAEPKNWKALVDIATNLTMAGSRVVLGMTGGAALAPIVTEGIKTIGRFVELLPQLAIHENRIPGLAAMQPQGETIKLLNRRSGGLERLATYFAVSSNFEAVFEPAKGLTKELAQLLLDSVTDGLFRVDNDLVVDTASMTDFGTRKPRFDAGDLHEFGVTDTVYHTIYFTTPGLAKELGGWLFESAGWVADTPAKKVAAPKAGRDVGLGVSRSLGSGPGIALGSLGDGSSRSGPLEDIVADVVVRDSTPAAEPGSAVHRAPPRKNVLAKKAPAKKALAVPAKKARKAAAASPKRITSEAAAAPAPVKRRTCHFYAEMEPYPRLEATISLVVTVSADKLRIAQHAAAKATDEGWAVDPEQDITWEVLAQRNCNLLGASRLTVPVPGQGEAIRETFYLNGVKAGAARIIVEARQGMNRLVQFVLSPTFVDNKVKSLQIAENVVLPGQNESLGQAAILRVYEISQSDKMSLYFALECRDPNISILKRLELASRAQLEGYVAELYKQVERRWAGSKPSYRQFINALEASGKSLARQILPEEIHHALWAHRHAIGAVQVVSDEPVIPWELLYVSDPAAGGQDRGFLCEWGMVRWLHNAPWPVQRLQLRDDRARCVIPDYVDKRMKLAGAKKERTALKKLFKRIKDAPAESVALCDFLGTEAESCDLLHFACHGEALEVGTIDAELQLTGRNEPEGIVPDGINGDQVRTRARFGADGDRPLIFINACQSGRPGTRLVQGVGGLIEAFIRPDSRRGAGAAVGTLWSIDDRLALTFAQTFYKRLLAGDTLITAARAAREAAKSNKEMTWLAYSVYGDPFAQVAGGGG